MPQIQQHRAGHEGIFNRDGYIIAGCSCFSFDDSESQKWGKFFEVSFCPSSDFGGRGDVGEESEWNDGENGVAGMDCIMLSGSCLEWGSGTLSRHSAKRASAVGAEGNAGMDMIGICEER